MKRLLSIALAMALILATAACGSAAPEATVPTKAPETTLAPESTQPQTQLPQGVPNYFQLSISDEAGNYRSLSAFEDGAGMITVDYQGDIRKVTSMGPEVMEEIIAALADSGLAALNGENIYEDGMASASMYVAYADGSFLGAGYSGTIPQAFLDGYDAMDAWFLELLAQVPEYVPRPVILGEVNEQVLAEFEAILDASGMEPLDMFSISDVPKDEYFTMALGLSDGTGILSGTACGPVMSATAYSCVIVTLEDEAQASRVQKDFAANVDWTRWVCVAADAAMIAQKGDLLLCLVGAQNLYQQTADAIIANGWTVLETLERN